MKTEVSGSTTKRWALTAALVMTLQPAFAQVSELVAIDDAGGSQARVSQLRASAQTAGVARQATDAATGEALPREAWSFAGYGTPEAAVQSLMFGMSQGNYEVALASMTPDEAEEETRNKTPEPLREKWRRGAAQFTTYRILDREEISAEEMVLMVYATGEKKTVLPMKMKKVGEEWKFAGMVTD